MSISCYGCNKKLTRVSRITLEFVTMIYCSVDCLKSFCNERLQSCCHCNTLVDDKARMKYCTRFGTKVEQFCSSTCLENYKKINTFCTLCKQKLGIMFISTEKKFCSLFCASRYNARGINQVFFDNRNPCSVCSTIGIHHFEILKGCVSEFLCSKECIKLYNNLERNKFDKIGTACSLCGCLLTKCKVNFFLSGWILGFCSEQCSSIYLTLNSEIFTCDVCNMKKFNFDLIRRTGDKPNYFCSIPCLMQQKLEEEKQIDHDAGSEGLMLRLRNSSRSTDSYIEVDESSDDNDESSRNSGSSDGTIVDKSQSNRRNHVINFLTKWLGNKMEEKSAQTNLLETMKKINSATQCMTSSQDGSSQTNNLDLVFAPFPVHIPTPVGVDAQFQIIPVFAPVPVPIPFPLLKKSTKRMKISSLNTGNYIEKKSAKLTFHEVAKQFILNNEQKKNADIDCKNDKKGKTSPTIENKDKKDDDPHTVNIIQENLLKINENSGDNFSLLDIDISNAWSPDSDIFEVDLCSPTPTETVFGGKKCQSEASITSLESKEVQLIVQLLNEYKVSSSTSAINESIGKKTWEEYVSEKSKNKEFMSKFSSKSLIFSGLSKSDKCLWLGAFISDVLQLNDLHPHIVVFVLFCIQKYFSSHSIFTCGSYQRPSNIFFPFLQNYLDTFSSINSFIEFSRNLKCVKIIEEMLWDSNQLGKVTPCALLFSIFYFNTKVFGLHSFEEHEKATSKDFYRYSRTKILKDRTPIRVKLVGFKPLSKHSHSKKKYPEVTEDCMNPRKCPVIFFELYLSKCPIEALSSPNFYFTPIIGCSPDDKIWFTSRSLPAESLSNMLNLTRMVEEVQEVLYEKP